MNLKKETLRKTTAFISALLFLSSSTGMGMTGASAANVQAGKTSSARSAGNSIVSELSLLARVLITKCSKAEQNHRETLELSLPF